MRDAGDSNSEVWAVIVGLRSGASLRCEQRMDEQYRALHSYFSHWIENQWTR
jgi:hypothetical protein